MRINVKHNELEGSVLLLGELIKNNKPKEIGEKLVYSIVQKIFQKLRIKSETPNRSGYGFSLSDQESLALFLFINHVDLMPDFYPYESLQLEKMSNEIHQKYV